METKIIVPDASAMMETFRAIGYSTETAIADIIDNSITAGATKIWIDLEWLGADSWISITDNGVGMDDSRLLSALRPGGVNPLDVRDTNDLGRYGLGLKTASFSQCRELTVISKRAQSSITSWTWDLNHVAKTNRWEVIKQTVKTKHSQRLEELESGTVVLWTCIDRIVNNASNNDQNSLNKFIHTMEAVKRHLAMVFHRFLEKKLQIIFQDREIAPWDPFISSHPATQVYEDEYLTNSLYPNTKILVKGYILPHKSRLKEKEYKDSEGPKGWNGQQGFYIYRAHRLLVAGSWLGMFRKEDHYKLARIKIDLPNSVDGEWQIDIKKSNAKLPSYLRDNVRAYASKVRNQAVTVFRHKGKRITKNRKEEIVPLWLQETIGERWYFKLNRQHFMIKKAKESPSDYLNALLVCIEQSIPTNSIYIKVAETPDLELEGLSDSDIDTMTQIIQKMFASLISEGKDEDSAISIIQNFSPFNNYKKLIKQVLK